MKGKHINIPNQLSIFRILSAPVLLLLAFLQQHIGFLTLLILSLLSDAFDGYLARRNHEQTRLGAQLDSLGDFFMFVATPIGIWVLWPEIIVREKLFIVVALVAYLVPIGIGFLRFHRLTSYHTWSAKASTVLLGITVLLMLFGGTSLPFRAIAFPVLLVSSTENLAITFTLHRWRPDVRTILHAVKYRERQRSP